jgi:hypothetical protein
MRIIEAVRGLLAGRVNELLGDLQFSIPVIEFGNYSGRDVIVPVIVMNACERSEKERLILLDAYSLTVTFCLPDTDDGELFCYAYSAAVSRALAENPTLDGVVDRAVITGKKYVQPDKRYCGGNWEMIMTLRLTVEGSVYAG